MINPLLLLTLLTSTIGAAPTSPGTPRQYVHFDCDTTLSHATPSFLHQIHDLHAASLNGSAEGAPLFNAKNTAGQAPHLAARAAAISVDTYIHVVTTAAHKGMITSSQITAQLKALNSAYNAHGIVFRLRGADYTTNDVWAVGGSATDDLAMKTKLRKGGYASLNLYFQSDLAGGVLGKCTLPTNIGSGPVARSVYAVDGCNIAAGTIPGGPIYGYNEGKTAVHETGHWLGLLHTFEGYSCTGNGDFVADTQMESTSTDGCPVSPAKNSCQGVRAGNDPIHNFMDYSTDECYVKFTLGQGGRMRNLWGTFRKGR